MANLCLFQKSLFVVVAASALFPGVESESQTLKPLVAGKRGVVAAGHALVAEAGLRILEKGGNAVDAGVATVFAASVVEMGSFGSGGECPILIKLKGGPRSEERRVGKECRSRVGAADERKRWRRR